MWASTFIAAPPYLYNRWSCIFTCWPVHLLMHLYVYMWDSTFTNEMLQNAFTDAPVCLYVGQYIYSCCTCMFIFRVVHLQLLHLYVYMLASTFTAAAPVCLYVGKYITDVPVCLYVGKYIYSCCTCMFICGHVHLQMNLYVLCATER